MLYCNLMFHIVSESHSANSGSAKEPGKSKELKKKSFRELFSCAELLHYGIAASIYIGLGILFQNWVLNWLVGPLFIVLWMWFVPLLVNKWRAR